MMFGKLIWPGLYVALIPLVNWSFTWAPEIAITDGFGFNPVSIAVGLVFVVRDFAQRAIGHRVLLAMGVALGLTLVLAGPELALASGAAFAVAELVDWALFTFTRLPLWKRVWVSSLFAAPVDTVVFLSIASASGAHLLTPSSVASWGAGKLVGAAIVAELIRRREHRARLALAAV